MIGYMHVVMPAKCHDCKWEGNDTDLKYIFEQVEPGCYNAHQGCPDCGSQNVYVKYLSDDDNSEEVQA